MDAPGGPTRGLSDTMRRCAGRLAQWASTRLDLAAVELLEERDAAIDVLVRLALAGLLAAAALFGLSLALVLVLPPSWRAAGAGVLTLIYATAAWLLYRDVRLKLRDRPPPLSVTREELKRDREWLDALK
jgi:uncharacterized membrane protein YqjE